MYLRIKNVAKLEGVTPATIRTRIIKWKVPCIKDGVTKIDYEFYKLKKQDNQNF